MAVFDKPQMPKAPPPPPTIADYDVQAAGQRQKAGGSTTNTAGGTILTSGQGLAAPASIGKKTLLGA